MLIRLGMSVLEADDGGLYVEAKFLFVEIIIVRNSIE